MLSELLFTIQEEELHYSKLTSETLTDINTEPNTSSLPKELIVDNTFSVVAKLQLQLVMCFQSTKSLRVQLFAILNLQLETKALTQDAQELMLLLLGTLKMAQEQESDFHLDQEKLFPEAAEQLLELLLEEVETRNQS